MSKKISVALHPDALLNVLVVSSLLWAGQLKEERFKDEEKALELYRSRGYVFIRADKFEGDHHFGPTMTFNGPRSPVELTIPWHHILGWVSDKSGKMKIGFEGHHAAVAKPKRKQP